MNSRNSWLRGFLSSYRKPVVTALALGLIAAAFSAMLMFTSGYLISATALEGVTLFSVMLPVAFVQVFGIGKPLARYFERLVSHSWVLRVTSDLRKMLYNHVASTAADPTQARASGEYLSILSDDIAHLQNLYLRVVFPSVVALLLACLATIAFGLFSPVFACVMLVVFAGTVIGLPMATLAATRVRMLKVKSMRAESFEKLSDDIAGVNDWKLSGRSREAIERGAAADSARRDLDRRIRFFDRTIELASLLILGLAACAVIAWSGSSFAGDPSTVNWIAAFVLGFFPIIESFAALPSMVPSSTDHMQSIDRLRAISDEGGLDGNRDAFPDTSDASIVVEGVTYAYPASRKAALHDLDCTIGSGQKVAILGKSGSGKTTLVSLVRGMLEPQSGTIEVGGEKMVARTYDVSGTIGYLSQEPYIFNKSLRDNLALARPDATDDELLDILEKVGLRDRYDALPNGLDTVIGETGTGFSGGEAHRIALARTLTARSKVIIVDEPFAALDPETEAELLETLFDACDGRTLIVVTHHLALVDRFDRVIFLEDGAIELDGSPAELERSNDHFRELLAFDRNL